MSELNNFEGHQKGPEEAPCDRTSAGDWTQKPRSLKTRPSWNLG